MTSDLEHRLRRLEGSNRRLRLLVGTLAVAAGLAASVRSADAKPEHAPRLKVEQLELVDAAGAVRARLGVEEDGAASLTIIDPRAGTKAVLTTLKSGSPGLVLRNSDGKGQLIASVGDTGPALVLCDPKGSVGASLTLRNEDGTSLLGFRLPGEKQMRASFSILEDGRSYVKLIGPEGELRMYAKPQLEFTPAAESDK